MIIARAAIAPARQVSHPKHGFKLHHSTANLILSTTRDLGGLRLPGYGATIHSLTSTVLLPPSYYYYCQTVNAMPAAMTMPPSRAPLGLLPSLSAKIPTVLSAFKSAVSSVATPFSVANTLASSPASLSDDRFGS
ncbi:unnamed protein product [Penicillium salamii]|nr:unnamed protein product [Penicillium salamii]